MKLGLSGRCRWSPQIEHVAMAEELDTTGGGRTETAHVAAREDVTL
jgi:hypothetical protein